MERNTSIQWLLLLLMAVVGVTTAYADEKDMGTWRENNNFGQNGADMTADGYSLWDGYSFQNYELRTSGEQQGIHIANAAQLARYAYDMFNYNNSYWDDRHTRDVYLECDIDLNNKYFSILRKNYYIENATFYGQGHVIRNGYAVDAGGRCALFSDIRGGEIRDLILVNYHLLSPNTTYCGILCAYAEDTYTNTYNFPTFRNCRLSNCSTYNETDVTYVGGIVGYAKNVCLYDNAVVNCKVTTEGDIAGGIVGYVYIPLEFNPVIRIERNRVVNSTVHATDKDAGGLIGKIEVGDGVDTRVHILHNYVQNCDVEAGNGNLLKGDHVGGLIGACRVRKITASYNYVHAKVISQRGGCYPGLLAGLVDFCLGKPYDSMAVDFGVSNYLDQEYWLTARVGSLGGQYSDFNNDELCTTKEMTEFRMNSSGYDYVYKKGAMPQHKDGFASDITITTVAQLQQLAADVNSGVKTYEGCIVKLGNDLDLSSISSFTPIGTSSYPFMGEFDGCGFTISGLTINRTDANDTGLFGYIHNAYIHDVILEAPHVVGGNYYTGALVGMAQCTCCVSDIWVRPSTTATPYVEGSASTGGIVGRSGYRILMTNCFFEGTVITRYAGTDDAWVGALAANVMNGEVCYSAAKATITRQDNGPLKQGLFGGMTTHVDGYGVFAIDRCYAANGDGSAAIPLVGSPTDKLSLNSCYTGTPQGANGMASTLGSEHWYYYQDENKLPLPITLSKDLPDSDLAHDGGFYFLPNPDAPDTYHAIEYKGNGGSVTIPATVKGNPVTRIDSDVFQGNRTFTSVTISDNITGIGHRAFEGCTALQTLNINSKSRLHIGRMAFAGCPALTTINFDCGEFDYTYTDNEGVTDGGYAFSNCTNITTLSFRGNSNALDGLKGKGAFSGCTSITDISADATAKYLTVLTAGKQNQKAGIVGKTTGALHMVIPDANTYFGDKEGHFEIPDRISTLAPGALDDTPWLTELTALSSLTTISAPSFQNCDNLKLIDFSACNYLKSITVDRTAAGNPFYGVSDKTMIFMPSRPGVTAAQGQKNVVIGNTATELAFTDGYDFVPQKDFTFPSATYDRVLNADKGYTACLPFPATLVQAGETTASWKVYEPSTIEDVVGVTTVTFTEVANGQMQAYKPYYIVVSAGDVAFSCTGGGSITAGTTSGTTTIDGASYQFKGSTATIANYDLYDAQKPAYILQSDGWWYKVPQNEPQAYVGPFRAYFQATTPDAASSLATMFSDSYTPGEGSDPVAIEPVIRTIDADGTERVFDLSGRRIDGNMKGIVIRNGKKVMNK